MRLLMRNVPYAPDATVPTVSASDLIDHALMPAIC
jgi:glycerol-3-phosphate O-acyltransferase